MKPSSRKLWLVAIVVSTLLVFFARVRPAETLPERLSDGEFWKLVTDFSEPDGPFISDNYVSNERSYQDVIPDIEQHLQPASAYLGVGPEQNFTYIAALKPRIAFIVDIRRQNMIEHLMYKALFDLSADRVEFLSRLFSRPRPAEVRADASIGELLQAFDASPTDESLFRANLAAIFSNLTGKHGFTLSVNDQASLQKIVSAFRDGGPALTYNGPGRVPGVMPSFAEVMTRTGPSGINRGFLASDANYKILREFEQKNLLIPVVGDFAGPLALKSVADYLKTHNTTVTAFYTSNVEQYLFMNNVWLDFYANVAALPVTAQSLFIRGLIRTPAGVYSASPVLPVTSRYETGLFSIAELSEAFKAGMVRSYDDVVQNRKFEH